MRLQAAGAGSHKYDAAPDPQAVVLSTSLTPCLVPAGSDAISHEDTSPGFMIGDKVIQTFNNYDKEVFNGDVGFVVAVDPRESRLTVQFPALEPGDPLGHLHWHGYNPIHCILDHILGSHVQVDSRQSRLRVQLLP